LLPPDKVVNINGLQDHIKALARPRLQAENARFFKEPVTFGPGIFLQTLSGRGNVFRLDDFDKLIIYNFLSKVDKMGAKVLKNAAYASSISSAPPSWWSIQTIITRICKVALQDCS